MAENFPGNGAPNPQQNSDSYSDYLNRAARSCEDGDLVLGMYLYLAAYEKANSDPAIADGMALSGLQEAWHLACDLKERSMAEYIFEQLEPYLMPEEIAAYAEELQNLALDRLEQFGFSRDDLQELSDMIAETAEFAIDGDQGVHMESFRFPAVSVGTMAAAGKSNPNASDTPETKGKTEAEGENLNQVCGVAGNQAMVPPSDSKKSRNPKMGLGVADVNEFNPYDMYDTSSVGTSYHGATNEGSGAFSFTRDNDRAAQTNPEIAARQESLHQKATAAADAIAKAMASMPSVVNNSQDSTNGDAQNTDKAKNDEQTSNTAMAKSEPSQSSQSLSWPQTKNDGANKIMGPSQELESQSSLATRTVTYRNLVGYDEAIAIMRDFGVGLQRDPGFRNFVSMLNNRHGLNEMPALDTILFRAPVLEDANRFVEATAAELGLPVLRMAMEESVQGMPVLCVTAQSKNRPRMNHAQNRFEGPGVLVIEDLYMWGLPAPMEGMEAMGSYMLASISRGAREAVNLIRSAVEDPDVYVFATATMEGEGDPFFYELLEPMTVIDIANPSEAEREAIWSQIMENHPSMRGLDRQQLARLSTNMSRFDIYMAAREAIEEAYKTGLVQRMFVPVSPQNIYDKIAACHRVESQEYKNLEDVIVEDFRRGLDDLDSLMNGPTGWL